ncbi:MAG: PDZ domain-containing protein, partial [Pseudomonadota bacterium]
DVGLTLRALSSSARSEFGIADEVKGVLVSEVAPDGAAAEKGVRPGDVIVEVGQEPVTNPTDVEERVKAAAGAGRKSVLFLIQSQGDLRFVPLAISE